MIDDQEEVMKELRDLRAKVLAYEILLTSESWGAAYGECSKHYPQILKQIDDYIRIHNLVKKVPLAL